MGSFIIFGDGRAWAPNNAIYDRAIDQIAAALPLNAAGQALDEWLLSRPACPSIPAWAPSTSAS